MPGFPHHSKWVGGLGGDNKGFWIFLTAVISIFLVVLAIVEALTQ
jgi:hypothetical protein